MWSRLSAARPNSAQPLQRIARLHIAGKDFDKAVDFMQRAANAPSDLVVGRQYVAALALAGRNDDALKEARRYQTAQPKSPAGFEFEGDAHFDQKRWAEAERSYRSALKLQPAAGQLAVEALLDARSSRKGRRRPRIRQRWSADHPKDPMLLSFMGDQALGRRDLKAATAAYEAVLAIRPDHGQTLNNLAWVYGETGDPRAVELAERAVKQSPRAADAHDTLGMLLIARGDTKRGMEQLEQARKLSPERLDLRVNYARGLAKAGQKDAARKEIESLLAIKQDFRGKSDLPALLNSL